MLQHSNHRGPRRRRQKEIKICIEMNENENKTTQKPVGHGKSSAKGKVHSNTGIPQETRKKSNNDKGDKHLGQNSEGE